MEKRCPRVNHPSHTVAKFQASIRDPRDESSASSAWHPQDEPPRFSQPHSSRSESGKTSKKGFREEKKKQRHLDHEQVRKDSTPAAGVHASKVASIARKDLSHFTCFNSDKKDHYATNCPEPEEQRHLRKLVTVLVTSALKRLTWTVPRCYSRTSSLQLMPGSIPER